MRNRTGKFFITDEMRKRIAKVKPQLSRTIETNIRANKPVYCKHTLVPPKKRNVNAGNSKKHAISIYVANNCVGVFDDGIILPISKPNTLPTRTIDDGGGSILPKMK
ncbi:MAG: hypothetical protein IJP47_00745 [Prevotella sp.]|nr:hypothetical protein [Prevotella sp.]